jgi:hypothetical protein
MKIIIIYKKKITSFGWESAPLPIAMDPNIIHEPLILLGSPCTSIHHLLVLVSFLSHAACLYLLHHFVSFLFVALVFLCQGSADEIIVE